MMTLLQREAHTMLATIYRAYRHFGVWLKAREDMPYMLTEDGRRHWSEIGRLREQICNGCVRVK